MVAMNLNTNTYVLACTTSSASITLSPQDANQSSLIVYNGGVSPADLVSGATSATAIFPTATGNPGTVIPAGAVVTVSKNAGDAVLAGITSTGTATLYIKPGAGE